jgi:hypothetical protein
MQCPETHACIYGTVFYGNVTNLWTKVNGVWTISCPYEERVNVGPYSHHSQKINSLLVKCRR